MAALTVRSTLVYQRSGTFRPFYLATSTNFITGRLITDMDMKSGFRKSIKGLNRAACSIDTQCEKRSILDKKDKLRRR